MSKQIQERYQQLLMGAIDGELTKEEQQELQQLLAENPQLQSEIQQYQKLKEVTQAMKLKSPSPEVWDRYWSNIYNRIERGIGWIIFSIGCMILLIYGIFKAVESTIADPQLATIIKIGILAVITGIVILLVSVFREKLFTGKKDPYKEVKR